MTNNSEIVVKYGDDKYTIVQDAGSNGILWLRKNDKSYGVIAMSAVIAAIEKKATTDTA